MVMTAPVWMKRKGLQHRTYQIGGSGLFYVMRGDDDGLTIVNGQLI